MKNKEIVGWREWLSLPHLGIDKIKAKIDTGARTSSLHAFDIEEFKQSGHTYVRFKVHPHQRNTRATVTAAALLVEKRKVKNSGGKVTLRPVILSPVRLGPYVWDIEITLISRDEMGFRMLLGRQAVKRLFLVDAEKSFRWELRSSSYP